MLPELANAKNTVIQNAIHLCGVNLSPVLARFVTISRTLPAGYPHSSRCYSASIADASCCLNHGKEIGPARQQAPDTDTLPTKKGSLNAKYSER